MISFGLKKWLGALLQPLPLLTLLIFLAIYFQIKGAKRAALTSQVATLIVFLLITTPPLSNKLISMIEGDIRQYSSTAAPAFIVVLGCGHTNNDNLPVTSQVHHCSLSRVTEGVRLFQLYPESKLIFSGFGAGQPVSNAETNKALAIALGVPGEQIFTEPRAKDTEEEATLLAPLLQDKTFALVTSASHMSRALMYFQQQGLDPTAAPTDHLNKGNQHALARQYLPDSSNIHHTEVAVYEFLGRIWQKINS